MSSLPVLVVEWGALGKASAAALVAGTGVTLFFSLAIYGAARTAEARRSGQSALAWIAGAVMVVGIVVSLAAVIAALSLMISG